MPQSCQPNDILADAECYQCLSAEQVDAIIVYLLCQLYLLTRPN